MNETEREDGKGFQHRIATLFGRNGITEDLRKVIRTILPEANAETLDTLQVYLPLLATGVTSMPSNRSIYEMLLKRGWRVLPAHLPGGGFAPKSGDLWVILDGETATVAQMGWVVKVGLQDDRIYLPGGGFMSTETIALYLRAPAKVGCAPCAAVKRVAVKDTTDATEGQGGSDC